MLPALKLKKSSIVVSDPCWARFTSPLPTAPPMVLPRFQIPEDEQVVVPEAVMREAVE